MCTCRTQKCSCFSFVLLRVHLSHIYFFQFYESVLYSRAVWKSYEWILIKKKTRRKYVHEKNQKGKKIELFVLNFISRFYIQMTHSYGFSLLIAEQSLNCFVDVVFKQHKNVKRLYVCAMVVPYVPIQHQRLKLKQNKNRSRLSLFNLICRLYINEHDHRAFNEITMLASFHCLFLFFSFFSFFFHFLLLLFLFLSQFSVQNPHLMFQSQSSSNVGNFGYKLKKKKNEWNKRQNPLVTSILNTPAKIFLALLFLLLPDPTQWMHEKWQRKEKMMNLF